MLSVISAEALKLTRHRATWGLVWIYPIGLTVIFAMAMVATLFNTDTSTATPSLAQWLEDAAIFWNAPASTVVRVVTAGFIAVAFAGEYGWNTWKLIVPHCSRWMLITAKYVVTIALLLASFILAALLMNFMGWMEDVVSGDRIPAGVTAGALIAAHWNGLLSILAPLLVTVAYASLASIITRSMIAALIVSVVAISLEQAIANFGPLLSIRFPDLTWLLFNGLPGYHISNLASWIFTGAAKSVNFPAGYVVAHSVGGSLAIIAAWVAGLTALTYWRFSRQDIN